MPGSKVWCRTAASSTLRSSPRSPTAASLPAGSGAAQARRRARRRKDRACLARIRKEGAGGHAGADYSLQPRFGELSFLHMAPGALRRSACPASRAVSRSRVQCRRSKDSTLTSLGALAPSGVPLTGLGGVMIKSELVQRIAARIRICISATSRTSSTHPRRDHRRHGARRPRRVARLRRFSVKHRPAARAQSAHRRACFGRAEVGAVLQDRQGMRERLNKPGGA